MRIIMTARTFTALVAAALLAGCGGVGRRTTTVESGGDVATAPAAVTPANNRTLPAGATLTARLDQALGTKISSAGDPFTATVSSALLAEDGSVVIPQGAKIHGRVTATDDSDNASEPALIRLDFDRISFGGQSYPFRAAIVQSSPELSRTDPTRQIVIGGVIGAGLGGLLSGGDLENIIIGGALGAAAGSIVSLGTEANATLPAGSQMTVRATQTTNLR